MGMLRTIAAGYWTALALGVVAIVLHVRWYTVDKAAGGRLGARVAARAVTARSTAPSVVARLRSGGVRAGGLLPSPSRAVHGRERGELKHEAYRA